MPGQDVQERRQHGAGEPALGVPAGPADSTERWSTSIAPDRLRARLADLGPRAGDEYGSYSI